MQVMPKQLYLTSFASRTHQNFPRQNLNVDTKSRLPSHTSHKLQPSLSACLRKIIHSWFLNLFIGLFRWWSWWSWFWCRPKAFNTRNSTFAQVKNMHILSPNIQRERIVANYSNSLSSQLVWVFSMFWTSRQDVIFERDRREPDPRSNPNQIGLNCRLSGSKPTCHQACAGAFYALFSPSIQQVKHQKWSLWSFRKNQLRETNVRMFRWRTWATGPTPALQRPLGPLPRPCPVERGRRPCACHRAMGMAQWSPGWKMMTTLHSLLSDMGSHKPCILTCQHKFPTMNFAKDHGFLVTLSMSSLCQVGVHHETCEATGERLDANNVGCWWIKYIQCPNYIMY